MHRLSTTTIGSGWRLNESARWPRDRVCRVRRRSSRGSHTHALRGDEAVLLLRVCRQDVAGGGEVRQTEEFYQPDGVGAVARLVNDSVHAQAAGRQADLLEELLNHASADGRAGVVDGGVASEEEGDALFELCDALLCTDGPVRTLVDLALAPEHRRGHGALYGGLNQGQIDVTRLRRALAGVPLSRAADGRLVPAADFSPWLRPDANTCADRAFCHTFGRGAGKHQMVAGWPYSIVAALETGRTSWTAVLDAVRLEPGADVAAVTTEQIREVVERLVGAGQWKPGDPDVLVVLDAGYDAPRIAHLLTGLPVEVLGRLRSDRVMRRPEPSRAEFFLANP